MSWQVPNKKKEKKRKGQTDAYAGTLVAGAALMCAEITPHRHVACHLRIGGRGYARPAYPGPRKDNLHDLIRTVRETKVSHWSDDG